MSTSASTASQPASRVCSKCGSALPARAQKCAQCGEYVNWKSWFVAAGSVIAFLILVLTNIRAITALFQNKSATEFAILGSGEDGTLLLIKAVNSGKKMSRLRAEFELEAAQPEIVEFGALTLVSGDERKAISAGGEVALSFDISYIRVKGDVATKDFWTQYGWMPVTFSGQVEESNGELRQVKSTAPLTDLKRLIQRRADPPAPQASR
jgi:predicted nucleic acid-binding Zn ribbon protein